MKLRYTILSFLIFCFFNTNEAQETNYRKKIGLTLSGGGAKGLAYIPLLKAIDSLGIQIDYLTGTSMGALVGGLYAIGYTGKELDSIARKLDWEYLLSDNIPLSKINMEEKDEYDKYLFELKSDQPKPTLPMGLIEGQNIFRMLNDLTLSVQNIDDFDKFKIPFRCYAADLVEGIPIEFKGGNLAIALRATMSIPTVFSPIDTANMLLVDGGILKNFPVEEVKEMGADFIIGANTSNAAMNKSEINSLFRIFNQMMSVSSSEDYEKKKDLCDLLLDYSEMLKKENLSTGDFSKAKEILDAGERIAKVFLPLLEIIAREQQQDRDSTYNEYVNWRAQHAIYPNSVKVKIAHNEYQTIIRNKIDFKNPNQPTNYEINRAIDRLYGTRFFDNVYYYLKPESDTSAYLIFNAEGGKKYSYKIGLHYDTDMSGGVNFNFTHRKFGKISSRSIINIDISDNPKFRIGSQIYLGESGWWLSSNYHFSYIKHKRLGNIQSIRDIKQLYSDVNLNINWTIGQNNLISFQSHFELINNRLDHPSKYDLQFPINSTQTYRTPYYNINFQLRLERNTFSRQYFPTKGIHVLGSLKYVPWGNGHQKTYQQIETQGIIDKEKIQIPFSAYGKLHLKMEQYIPLHQLLTLHYRWDAGLMFISHGFSGRDFRYPTEDAFYTGGINEREKERQDMFVPFMGYRIAHNQSYNFSSFFIETQIEPFKKFYVLPRFSVMVDDSGNELAYGDKKLYINQFKGNMKWTYGGGLALAYDTRLGPIKIAASKSNHDLWGFYASIGYRF